MTDAPQKRLTWRLRIVMAERNIPTATELQRLLEKSGYQVTSSQLTRIIKERPERISTDFLDHLLVVLDCHIDDLLRSNSVEGEDTSDSLAAEPARARKPRVRKAQPAAAIDEDLTGPKVTAFPIPNRK